MAYINRIDQLPPELRGPSQNIWGGRRTQTLRTYPTQTYGPASECRIYTKSERDNWAAGNDDTAR